MSIINQEWLNGNSLRAYPIKEDCLRVPVDSSGALLEEIRLPDYLLVDFVLTMALDTPVSVYLSQVVLISNLLTLSFKDQAGVVIALLSVDLSAHVTYAGYNLTGTGVYEDVRGRVVLGDLTKLSTDLPDGVYNFSLATAEFETCTIRPDIRGVRSLQLSEQGNESSYIYGHIKLLAGSNVKLTYLAGYNAIRIDAISGEGLNEECDCGPVGKDTVVKTINGIPVEDAVIVGDGSCVDVSTSGNTITISDTCSKPCCGCPELEFITESLKILETSLANLQTFSTRLSERIETFVSNYILTIM